MLSENPYIAGNSVGGSPAFVGRAEILRDVRQVLRHRQENAIVLYGQRRIGKTSVLKELEAKLKNDGVYHPIFFDLLGKVHQSLEKVLSDLADTISDGLGTGPSNLGKDPKTEFRKILLPNLLNNLGTKSLVLLFDEFDALDDPTSKQTSQDFFHYLRDLLFPVNPKERLNPERISFVFVIGRNIDDIDNIALSLFKGISTKKVSLLEHKDTIKLIRFSEVNNSLQWTDEVIEKVWELTNGHPFLTQCLCKHIWDHLYDEMPNTSPVVTLEDIEAAIPKTLDSSRSALDWLWSGLPPAEQVVASVLASVGAKTISESDLESLLKKNGMQDVKELKNAPNILQKWDLIEKVEGGYRFRVELLRRWIEKNKSPGQGEEVEDFQEKVNFRKEADIHYKHGLDFYEASNIEKALSELNRAVMLNPAHEKANQKLAEILIEKEQYEEARKVLERLYRYQKVAARERLISVLLTLAKISEREHGQQGEKEQLDFYKKVLELDAEEPEAKSQWQKIWQRRGNEVLGIKNEDDFEQPLAQVADKVLDQALGYYQKGKLYEQVNKIEAEQHRRTMLAGWYQQGKVALKNGDKQKAQKFFIQVLNERPTYEEAAKLLNKAVAKDFWTWIIFQTWLKRSIPTVYLIKKAVAKAFSLTWLKKFIPAVNNKKFRTAMAVAVVFLMLGVWFFFIPFDTSVTPDNVIGSNEAGIKPLVTTSNTSTPMLENLEVFNAAFRSNFSYVDEETNELAGFDVDILREFARRWFDNENAVTLIPMTADHYVDNLVNKKVKIVTSTTTESVDMKEHIDFSVNYFQYHPRLLVQKEADITDVCKLKGKKIAVIQGSTAIKTVKKALKAKCGFAIEIDDRFQNNSEIIEALKGQEVKAFMTNEGMALKFLLDVHADLEPILVMLDYEFKKEFYRFGVPKGDDKFLNRVNLTLQEMESDGTYARIYCKWFVTKPPYVIDFPEYINDDPKLEKKVKMKSSSFKECYPIEYTVQNGETLSELAKRFYGKSTPKHWDHIFGYNKNKETGVLIDNKPNRQINAGKKLWIPEPLEDG
jgi:ABC-type amino acid transport substrate-binding protein/tetratricopeptide (TPR) repeat protein